MNRLPIAGSPPEMALDLIRQAGGALFEVVRTVDEWACAGSIDNARQAVADADRRKALAVAVTVDPDRLEAR